MRGIRLVPRWRSSVVSVSQAIVVALAAAGCAGFSGGGALPIGLEAGTDRPVMVYVNDTWVGTFAGGTVRDDIDASVPVGPPWRLEARTDDGVVLVAVDVPSVPASGTGVGAAATTTCGPIALWVGDTRPQVPSPDPSARPVACEGDS